MSSYCGNSLQLCGVRVTKLDDLGNVSDEEDNAYITDKSLSIVLTPQIIVGPEINIPGGCCPSLGNAKQPDSQVRMTFAWVRQALEPALQTLLVGGDPIVDGANVIGATEPPPVSCGGGQLAVALEFWTKNWNGDAQDQVWPWWHFVYSSTSWSKAPSTAANDLMSSTVNGFSRTNDLWGNGPWGDQPTGIDASRGAFYLTQEDPPTAECGWIHVAPGS